APFGPRNPNTSPGRTFKFRSLTATFRPSPELCALYSTRRFLVSRIVSIGAAGSTGEVYFAPNLKPITFLAAIRLPAGAWCLQILLGLILFLFLAAKRWGWAAGLRRFTDAGQERAQESDTRMHADEASALLLIISLAWLGGTRGSGWDFEDFGPHFLAWFEPHHGALGNAHISGWGIG